MFGLLASVFSVIAHAQTAVERGEYVLRAGGCIACHTNLDNDGAFLAGGRALETPFGTFYSPNITPNPDHGIGGWSIDDFAAALTRGEGPDDVHYYPVFPFTSYSGMRPEDVEALFAYLQSVPSVAQADKPHDLAWYMQSRIVNRIWKYFFFEPKEPPANMAEPLARGAYLVTVLGHCPECHTPRDLFGALEGGMHLAGTREGPEGDAVPNITPDRETGIGRWSRTTLARYLRRGMLPDGDFAGGLMVDVIDESLQHLSAEDISAIVEYLRSIPPLQNEIVRQ